MKRGNLMGYFVAAGAISLLALTVSFAFGLPETEVRSPEGFHASQFEKMVQDLAARNTKNLVILRNGKLAFEWYSPDSGPDKRHYTASLAKALVGGLSLMLAAEEGSIRIDDPAWVYIPEWRDDPLKSKITIRHLATHTSGIEDAEENDIPHMELPGWKGRFWRREPDPFSQAVHEAPVLFAPGSDYAYSNPGMAALAYAVTASLRGSESATIYDLLKRRVMDPLAIPESEWSIGYGQGYTVDGLELFGTWGGGSYTARAVARIGQWMLQRGNWKGRQLVEPAWVDCAVRYAGTPLPDRPAGNPQPGSGLGWWTNFDRNWDCLPADAFAGAGAGQQLLLVVPSLDLVVVRNGGVLTEPEEGLGFWGGIETFIFKPLVASLNDYAADTGRIYEPPYPASPVIASVHFADTSTIRRRAAGSDNWPLTWAADDSLITAYGDGWGFEPRVERKLSLGFARIEGTATDFQASNLRSESGEQVGDGAQGRKASGLLAVGGELYLWARNDGNSRLASSRDGGRTLRWADWKFDVSFGHPTFLNFGRAYEGARDDYVYVYSPESDSAYEPSDWMVLARVPSTQILDRSAYEFFSGVREGQPQWSSKIEERKPVFSHPGKCYRSSISYVPPLQRYLWVQIHPGDAPRFFGGLSIYDSPEPWGPWTTVYYTEHWDVGPGENAHLPVKWMSPDGRTLYLVFSGDDAFSVRRLDLTLR